MTRGFASSRWDLWLVLCTGACGRLGYAPISSGDDAAFADARVSIDASAADGGMAACALGFVSVPPLPDYTLGPFCVAKYEMKDRVGLAVSESVGLPWVNITRDDAIVRCRAVGAGYDLISNAEFQTVARHIEQTPENWEGGLVGSGSVNRGHSDADPMGMLAAAADDDPCFLTNQTCGMAVWSSQRRTHRLPTGDVIWDFAGNAREWVSDTSTMSYGPDEYVALVTDASHPTTGPDGLTAKQKFGPAGDYSMSHTMSPYAGLGRGFYSGNRGAVLRGGDWANQVAAGVFYVSLLSAATGADDRRTFRCVEHLP